MNRKVELLAPAGGPEAGHAALTYGADAVYLGLKRFSARAEAANFTLEELDGFTSFAHAATPRRRVFAAVNTLVLEAELPELAAALASLRDVGVDGVLVQDLGVANVLRRHFPSLDVHASTQMAVHNLRGVEALARLGVRRAVAARELTLDELRALCSQTDVEIECFVHGALCYSYSGLCLFSSHALGRSANRGRCAYVCGGSFTPEGKPARGSALPFAMKDLALPGRLAALAEAGVASFKIEGRKKSPLYVAAVTDYYRRALDGAGAGQAEREASLRTVFSRPWTELYLSSPRQNASGEPRAVGHRGAPLGAVLAVKGSRKGGTTVVFRANRPLEAHDGLQLELPGFVKPFGFAVEKVRAAGAASWEFAAGPGEVEVPLPLHHPPIPAGTAVHCTSSQAVKRTFHWSLPRAGEFRTRRPLTVDVHVTPERLSATVGVNGVPGLEAAPVLEEPFTPARAPGTTLDGARAAFERLGNTPFSLGALTVANPQNLYVAPSQWNRLRRAATEALEQALAARGATEAANLAAHLSSVRAPDEPDPGPPSWSLKTDRPALLSGFSDEDWEGIAEGVVTVDGGEDDAWFAALASLEARLGRERLRLALPPVVRSWDEERAAPTLARLLAAGWRRWEVANLAHWGFLGLALGDDPRAAGYDLTADWPLYAVNGPAAAWLLEVGLTGFAFSPEDGAHNLGALLPRFGTRGTVLVYQHTPLFVSETCPRATVGGTCPGANRCTYRGEDLVSDFGNRVRVVTRRCRTVVVSRLPFSLAAATADLARAGARRFRVDLQYGDEQPDDAAALWRALRAGRPPAGAHEGNYRRGLQ